MDQYPTIYGLQARWFKWDRLYRIYVTADCLCGAYIAGQVYDEHSAAHNLQSFHLLVRRSLTRSFQRRKDREARYEEMDPTTREFLAQDDRNFHIQRIQIINVTVNRRGSPWRPYTVGSAKIHLGTGEIRRFILVGDQDPDAIAERLKLFHPETTTIGESSPLPKKREPTRHDWMRCAAFSALCLGFTILCLYLAFLRAQHLGYFVIGAINFCAAIYCLRLAHKYRALPMERKNGA